MKSDETKQKRVLDIFNEKYIKEKLQNTSIFITGATGLIGQSLVKELLLANNRLNLKIIMYILVRDKKKAEVLFSEYDNLKCVKYIEGNILDEVRNIPDVIDYIIHGASITDSMMFIEKPIETINTGIFGTENILELAKEKKVKSVVYLSSMEVYGQVNKGKRLKESDVGYLDPLMVRSSYPETKRMCENICVSYNREYGVPAKIIRLAQTFGPGVKYDDRRVFAEFARCAIELKNIVLHTAGDSARMYLYTSDAVEAIITVLLQGENGRAYNAANEKTYCSIKQMAKLIKEEIARNAIEILIEEDNENVSHYAPEHYLYLDTEELTKLGWKPKTNLKQAFINMIDEMKREKDGRIK